MANAYFFNNETKTECIYVKNTGTCQMEVDALVRRVCQEKKWESSDRVIVMLMNSENLMTYLYQNNKFVICFDTKYDCMEIVTHSAEIEEDNFNYDNYDSEDYDEYNDYDIEDDRYDERDDYGYGYDGGYEDEFYECCDVY